MKTAFVIFEKMTALDMVGIYDPLTRLKSMNLMPEFSWEICALTSIVCDDRGLCFSATSVAESLADYDLLVVPGGFGTRPLQYDKKFIRWLKTAAPVRLKASVCTGSLLLGAAGFLEGKSATTHPAAVEELRPYCSSILDQRVVDEGDVVTAGGVTAAIDLGLYLVERVAGKPIRARIAQQMDYLRG
ncbi:MAG: DJ-1/PfpI family protein [Desulfuromonadales bacterium]|jgi:cyclohexyl-isocyanide hydratase|nr:DJ-1/PfpI family protein [Desulfuromonadales bacterium]